MCFSEEASFSAALFLTAAGVAAVKKVNKHPKNYLMALIPLFFAIQQGSEGFQWLYQKGIYGSAAGSEFAKNIFLFFALLFWPVWMPLSVYIAEEKPKEKRRLFVLLLLGLATSFIIGRMWFSEPATVIPGNGRLEYTAHLSDWVLIPYTIASMGPWLINSLPRTRYLGIFFLVAFIVALWFYVMAFTSVWCFFCAVMSLWIYAIISADEKGDQAIVTSLHR